MSDEPSIKLAKSLIKEGNKPQAIQVLGSLVKVNPQNELAWLWLAYCVDESEKKRFCLQKALSIESNNLKEEQALKTNSPIKSTVKLPSKGKKTVSLFALGAISFLSLIVVIVIILGFIYLPSKLALNLPVHNACNQELLSKAMGIIPTPPRTDTLGEWSEAMFQLVEGAKEGTLSWTIESRNEYGCVATLSGDINGVKSIGYVWFIDLDQKKVFPDNPGAKSIVDGWIYASGDYDLANGFPLP